MEIEIISKENIKPSKPTPSHLKTFELSLLDQLAGGIYIRLVLYYPNHNDNNILQAQKSSLVLKESLSKTLTQFYPLAGTIKNNLSIDCNDIGACYTLALVHRHLDEFLSHPNDNLIKSLMPTPPTLEESLEGARVTYIQMNVFECGGIAIGLSISHKIVDAASIYTFLNGWTNMARGAKEVVCPNLTAASLFPAKDQWLINATAAIYGPWFKEGECITKRFVFNGDAISALKDETTRNGVMNPTRVEVVSALIWKCAMEAFEKTWGLRKPSCLIQMVNLRRKLGSINDLFGNVLWMTPAEWQGPPANNVSELVKKVHEGISKIDIEFVKKAQGDKEYVMLKEYVKEIVEIGSQENMETYAFTSWCKMGFYEVDFGWGKPSWVAGILGQQGSPVFINSVTLMDTKCGEGIEAWVNLNKKEMEILQSNSELLAYASLDPSPLERGVNKSSGVESSKTLIEPSSKS